MKHYFKNTIWLFKNAYKEYSEDDTWVLGAALSYYTIFSLAPILIIIIAVAGMIYGKEAVTGQIYDQIKEIVGSTAALQVQAMVKSAYAPGKSTIATIIAIGLLIFGSTTVFYQLQSALNKIWEVKPNPKKGLLLYIRSRVLSFGMIIAIGFLLLVSLVVNALMLGLSKYLMSFLPDYSVYLFQILNLVLSLIVITLLFAMIYKFLPDAVIRWRDVWAGSLFTAILFTLGRYGIAYYLGKSDIGSAYGAAGSIVVLLVWVSYSSQILFFGAEFTQVYARRYGTPILPAAYAKRVKMVEVQQKADESSKEFDNKVQEVKIANRCDDDLDVEKLQFNHSAIEKKNVRTDAYYNKLDKDGEV